MPTKEMLAACIANLRACVSMGFAVPNWQVDELLTAYDDAKNEANLWRRTHNRTADAYRDLLASKPEVYLVDGHDAAYWARNSRKETDIAVHWCTQYSAMYARHEALSTEYLALRDRNNELLKALLDSRTKYDRLQRVATECEDELREIRQINS